MKHVLFIVPHEDDELFVGGPMIMNLTKDSNYEVDVFISTAGDYYPFEYRGRIKESLNALDMMGVSKDHVYFGGYGDGWKGNHLYNAYENEERISEAGFQQTYSADQTINEWAYLHTGSHHRYTRKNYRNDIKSLILSLKPEIIICVDMDTHQDHRCLSLLTDEAMCEILKENPDYEPVFLKKYAYQGVLGGTYDFFQYPHLPAVNQGEITSNPYFRWSDRIRYRVPESCNTLFLTANPLYKISKAYISQGMWTHAEQFINTDVVYWQRHTNNKSLTADIKVSSGNPVYLNDFKLLDSDDIIPIDIDYSKRCWRPDEKDDEKIIRISFPEATDISILNLYFNCIGQVSVKHGTIRYYNDETALLQESPLIIEGENLFLHEIHVQLSAVKQIEIRFNDVQGVIGIGEIECLETKKAVPFQEYLVPETKTADSNRKYTAENWLLAMERFFFKLKILWYVYVKDSYQRKRIAYNKKIHRQ